MSRYSEASLEWSVILPAREETSLGGRRPRARLVIVTEDRGEETFFVPTSVGKKLRSRQDSGELKPGSRAELLHDLAELERRSASERVAYLVNRRDYSAAQLGQKLSDDGYPQSVVEPAVTRALECGLVDDVRFAGAFIRSGISRGWGRMRIERELRRRGVDPSDVPGWPGEFLSDEDEEETALRLAASRRLTGKNDYQKLVRFLVGRGYSIPLSTRVVRRILNEGDGDF